MEQEGAVPEGRAGKGRGSGSRAPSSDPRTGGGEGVVALRGRWELRTRPSPGPKLLRRPEAAACGAPGPGGHVRSPRRPGARRAHLDFGGGSLATRQTSGLRV